MRSFAALVGRSLGAAVTLALAAVIVVGLFGLGFSGGIGDDYSQLRDLDAPRSFDLVITDVASGAVSLEGSDAEMLARGARWGLDYPGGYGRVGEPTSEGAATVVRTFERADGTDPVPGTVGRLDPITWVDAADAGLDGSEVAYTTELGSYPSLLLGPTSETWLIVVHHRAQPVTEGLRMATIAADAGVTTLLISYRNDRDAPRSPNAVYEWGASEWRDLEGAVGFARLRGAEEIVLAGYGMGGSIVLSYLDHADDPSTVVGVILDSPIIDVESTVRFDLSQDQVGAVFDVPDAFNAAARLIGGWRFGLDWDDLDYSRVDPGVPSLIFHGEADAITPISESERYAASFGDRVRLVAVPGAGFSESWNADPEAYARAVTTFLGEL